MNDDQRNRPTSPRYQFGLRHIFGVMLAVAVWLSIARWSLAVAALVLADLFLVVAMVILIRAGGRYRRRVAQLPISSGGETLGCLRLLVLATGAVLLICSAATVGLIGQLL